MEKCDCYFEQNDKWGVTSIKQGHCNGTKECDVCSCGGDRAKCDFYEHVRKEAQHKMNTATMWLQAQKDGKTYRYIDFLYNKETGFTNSFGDEWENLEETLSEFMAIDNWKEEPNILTKAEAEKKYGITIIG